MASQQAVSIEVFNPAGTVEVVQQHAPRPASLDGLTIGELSNGVWEDARIFEKLRHALAKLLPNTRFVPFTEFPIGSEQIDSEAAIDLLQAKGCHAVITANAA
ncbi:MAG: hypothetical protein ACKVQK_18420 [Burkholderiales bacterium]